MVIAERLKHQMFLFYDNPDSVAEPLLPPTGDVERDFFSHLYSGDMTALEGSSVPEDYYNYLESWYRAQKGK